MNQSRHDSFLTSQSCFFEVYNALTFIYSFNISRYCQFNWSSNLPLNSPTFVGKKFPDQFPVLCPVSNYFVIVATLIIMHCSTYEAFYEPTQQWLLKLKISAHKKTEFFLSWKFNYTLWYLQKKWISGHKSEIKAKYA